MKNILILFTLLIAFSSFGQEPPEFPKYDAKNAAKIFYYNLAEAPKKIKVKDADTKNKTVKQLRAYNDKIKKISFLKTPILNELELAINTLGNKLYTDRALSEAISKRVTAIVLPIRDSISSHEKKLNDNLKSFLSKKQFKKWLKYQRGEIRKLIPKRPSNNNAPPQNRSRSNNQRTGGRRY